MYDYWVLGPLGNVDEDAGGSSTSSSGFTLVEVQLHGVSVGFDETTIGLAGEIPVSLKLRISKGPCTDQATQTE